MKKKLSYLKLMQCFASIFKGPPEFMTCNFFYQYITPCQIKHNIIKLFVKLLSSVDFSHLKNLRLVTRRFAVE